MEIFTIGFTRKTAEEFFGILRGAGIEQLLDVRLNNSSQLAGFAKKDDLRFFLKELCGASYRHEPILAPTPELLDDYRKHRIPWSVYEARFLGLMEDRKVEQKMDPEALRQRTVLLCSEPTEDRCHRRLVLDYLRDRWSADMKIRHL